VRLGGLELRRIDETVEQPLAEFFRVLKEAGDDAIFHPHRFTDDEANRRTRYKGNDLYYVLVDGNQVLGYGMLRGWDEGYEIPSLGIAIHPEMRGQGLGYLLMNFLHAAARRRGALKVRLKVYAHNDRALRLYKQLGYEFLSEEAGQLVGYFDF
jgi:ribosomal protein S18 acetylase RimI-like enzyme